MDDNDELRSRDKTIRLLAVDLAKAAEARDAALKELAERDSFAWLIEAPGARYLAVRTLGGCEQFYWTVEHDKAVRFHTKDQADNVMQAVRRLDEALFAFAKNLGEAKPVEHGWS